MITVKIPKKGKSINLDKEIALARNIKDKTNRNNTIMGLVALNRCL